MCPQGCTRATAVRGGSDTGNTKKSRESTERGVVSRKVDSPDRVKPFSLSVCGVLHQVLRGQRSGTGGVFSFRTILVNTRSHRIALCRTDGTRPGASPSLRGCPSSL